MDQKEVLEMLDSVSKGIITPEEALKKLKTAPSMIWAMR